MRLLVLVAGFWLTPEVRAQNYPVQAIAGFHFPIPASLESMRNSGLNLTLLHKDFASPEISVFLRFRIEGPGIVLESAPAYIPGEPIRLSAGVPVYLTSADLSPLFESGSYTVSGISQSRFVNSGTRLPSGDYRFSFQACDFATGLTVSNRGEVLVQITGNLPPVINLPEDGSEVPQLQPQNLVIQFTPGNLYSQQTQYKVRITEVIPFTRHPAEAMASGSQPLIELYTGATTVVLGPDMPPLINGRKYAVQVQAIDPDGLESFENQGYSAVVSFIYGSACPVPEDFHLTDSSASETELHWNASEQHRAFELSYGAVNRFSRRTDMVFTPGTVLQGLLPGTRYEFVLSGVCDESKSKPARILVLTDTAAGPAQLSPACGKALPVINLGNRNPLAVLTAGDDILAADFKVHVLSASGDNGTFSGTGTVLLPFTGKIPIPCTFQDIQINSSYRLISGHIRLLRKPIEISNRKLNAAGKKWNQWWGKNWNALTVKNYPGTISGIKSLPDGHIQVSGTGGSEQIPTGDNRQIRDENGRIWRISAGGRVSMAEGPQGKPFTEDLRTCDGCPDRITAGVSRVYFIPVADRGFDAADIRQLTAGAEYEKLECPDSIYFVGWKKLQTAVWDTITAIYHQNPKSAVPPDSIRFSRTDGTLLRAELNGTTFSIPVCGSYHLYADAVWAWYMDYSGFGAPKRVVVGKLNLINTDPKKIHVWLIPVNGLGVSTETAGIEQELNMMTLFQGLTWTVGVHAGFNSDVQTENTAIEVDRFMLGTSYSGTAGRLISGFEAAFPHAAYYNGTDTAWMLLLPRAAHGEDGYMALGRNCGFVFLNGRSRPGAHTLAHESGHGLFGLEHIFEQAGEAGYSQNLMDYSPPYALLNHTQWLQIHDPGERSRMRMHLSQQASEGRMLGGRLIPLEELEIPRSQGLLHFVTPAGKTICLHGDSLTKISFSREYMYLGRPGLTAGAGRCNGTATGFEYNGRIYRYRFDMGQFTGFVEGGDPARRLDQEFRYRYNGTEVKVFAGFEDTDCRLLVRTGRYTGPDREDLVISRVLLTDSSDVVQYDYTTQCLEWFPEDELSVYARRYWDKARSNPAFKAREPAIRRVVRLIHELGQEYRYFHYGSYLKLIEKQEPTLAPVYADPEKPFDSVALGYFENYLRNCLYLLARQNEFFSRVTDEKSALRLMLVMPTEWYEKFSLGNRVKALRLLLQEGLHSISWSAWLNGNSNEAIVRHLLVSTPEEQLSDLLDTLIQPERFGDESHMLAALYADISGLDGKNYDAFVDWLLRNLLRYRPCPPGFSPGEALESGRLLNFSSGFWGDGLLNWFNDRGRVELTSRKVFTFYIQRIEAAPYEWLYLKFTDDFEFLGRKFGAGTTLRLPAVCVSAMFDTENRSKLSTTGHVALDIALFLVGVGEVKAVLSAAGGFRKTWLATRAIADLGFTIGDLSISAGLGEKLNESVSGQEFLNQWNNIQLYWGIGSLAESGINAVIKKLYRNADEIQSLRQLSGDQQAELDALLAGLEKESGVLRSASILRMAGRVSRGKNLLNLPAPVGEFRQLAAQAGNERKYYRAADFWKKEGDAIEHYITRDGKYYIKRDPATGQALFLDVENERFIGYYLDEDGVFNGDYESLATSMRTVHGLDGGLTTISVSSKIIELDKSYSCAFLGRYDPSIVDHSEIGTLQLIASLSILKNYSFANNVSELQSGSIHLLNIPEGLISLANEKGKNFWQAYNLAFLNKIVSNESHFTVTLLTTPSDVLLRVNKNGILTQEPSVYALELYYLFINNVTNIKLYSGQVVDLAQIDFTFVIKWLKSHPGYIDPKI